MRISDALKQARLSQALHDNGFSVGSDTEVREIASAIVLETPYDEGTLLTSLTGWHGRQYVRPDGQGIGKVPTLIFVPPEQLQRYEATGAAMGVPREEVNAGTVEDWVDGIGRPASASSVLAFALAASFAALILKPAHGESGLSYLTSPDLSKGKTTSLLAALSLQRKAVPRWALR
jgi:hypothetical protein